MIVDGLQGILVGMTVDRRDEQVENASIIIKATGSKRRIRPLDFSEELTMAHNTLR